jgi:multidrug efflux pump subunit AcrA (membrane-fusion protein)
MSQKIITIERKIEITKIETTPKNIRLNETRAIQTILGHPPNWLLRWGILLIALFTIILITMSWLIRYPDIIVTQVSLTNGQPPIRVLTTTNGRLDKCLVNNHQTVQAGTVLAELNNTAASNDIVVLDTFLARIENINIIHQLPINLPRNLVLGELQMTYSAFIEAYKDLLYLKKSTNAGIKIKSLNNQIQHIKQLKISQKKQFNIFSVETEIALKNWQHYQYLHKKKGCTQIELKTKERAYLQHQRQAENLKAKITSSKLQIEQIKFQIAELNQNQTDRTMGKFSLIQEQTQRLKREIERWKATYLIVAPISGKVVLSDMWATQQFLNANTEILTIIPSTDMSNPIIARAIIPTEGAGKVKSGMKVIISFLDYPRQEFGTISAEVNDVALIPKKNKKGNNYQLTLTIPKILMTNYEKTIPFNQGMEGTAKVITEDKRILERVMQRFFELVNG